YLETYSEYGHIIPINVDGNKDLSTERNFGLNNAGVYVVADKYDIHLRRLWQPANWPNEHKAMPDLRRGFRHGTSYSAVGARSLALQVHRRMFCLRARCQVVDGLNLEIAILKERM